MAQSQIGTDALSHELAQAQFSQLYPEQGRAILAYALRRVEGRELLRLVSWEGLSPGEAAKVLEISSLAARSRLHRARRRLRTLMEVGESTGRPSPELDMEEAR